MLPKTWLDHGGAVPTGEQLTVEETLSSCRG